MNSVSQSPTWNKAQAQAIRARGQNVLVNAGAGAGKTATLVERVIQLVMGPDAHSLDELLIVTFTKAASREMRERLGKALRKALEAARLDPVKIDQIPRLQSQINILPRAQISTLHSFCLNLLRQHAGAIGLAPDFEVMADDEVRLLRHETIQEVIENALAAESDGVLFDLLSQLSPASAPDELLKIVENTIGFLEGLSDPRGWIDRLALPFYDEAADDALPLAETRAGRMLIPMVEEPLREALALYEVFLQELPGQPEKSWAQDIVAHCLEAREHLRALLRWDDATAELAGLEESAPLPDLCALLKLPPRRNAGKNPEPATAYVSVEGGVLKDALEPPAKALSQDWLQEGQTLAQVRAAIAATRPYVRLLLVDLALAASDALLEKCLDQKRLTYSHLESLTLRLLVGVDGEPTAAARDLQAETAFVLVDEFQDVNGTQAALLKAVARAGRPDAPRGEAGNLFVVGDVKQSIYRFRQADPTQFQALYRSFADFSETARAHPGARIDLLENYRSAPPLLEELNRFFAALFSPRIGAVAYDARQAFRPGLPEPAPEDDRVRLAVHLLNKDADEADFEDSVQDHEVSDREAGEQEADDLEAGEREARYLVTLIRRLHETEGVPYKDIAVLVRSASGYATKLAEAFNEYAVPFFTQANLGFLAQQEIQDVLALLRVIDNPYRDVSLVGVLRGPSGGWSEDDLARLRLLDRDGRIYDNLRLAAERDAPSIGDKARAILDCLAQWREASKREKMADLFAHLYDELNLPERLATLPNGDQRRLNLQFLQDRGVQFDRFRRKGLGQFLRFLEDLIERDQDLGTPAAEPVDDNSVKIMTIHASKGLEFPHVFIPFIGKKFNTKDLIGNAIWDRETGFAVKFFPGAKYGEKRSSAAPALLRKALEDQARGEELRLLYVAMTRAKQSVTMIGTAKKMADVVSKHQEALAAGESRTGLENVEETAAAKSFLDWTLLALRGRAEFLAVSADTPQNVSGLDALQVLLVTDPARELGHKPEPPELDVLREQQGAELLAYRGQLDATLARIAHRTRLARQGPVRAKVSVTEAKRAYDAIHTEENPPAPRVPRFDGDALGFAEWVPPIVAGVSPTHRDSARNRGTVTHRYLSLLDLEHLAKDPGDALSLLQAELARLVEEGFLTADEADLIDLESIWRFFASELGNRVLKHHARARRERAFTVAVPAVELDRGFPAPDEPMIFQGMIDLYWTERDAKSGSERLILLDFKTDWCGAKGERVAELTQSYESQMLLYAVGLEKSLKRPVDEIYLYFLDAGQGSPLKPLQGERWLSVLRAAAMEQTGPSQDEPPAGGAAGRPRRA
ncbi:MAG: UvrD-helicase domain-containing protein [Sumerlaeia bacterium]